MNPEQESKQKGIGMFAPKFIDGGSVGHMALFNYLNWVVASRENIEERLTLPPVQRSALWRPRQILTLWRSIFDGMPLGSFYLSRPGTSRRVLQKNGESETINTPDAGGFDLLDGQQRTLAMLLAVDPPQDTGKCVWVEAFDDRIELLLTTRAHPFGFDENGERLGVGALRKAYDLSLTATPFHELFDKAIREDKRPVLPIGRSTSTIWPLNEIVAEWTQSVLTTAPDEGVGRKLEAFRGKFGKRVCVALSSVEAAEIAFIRVLPPANGSGGEWLLNLFDRIGAGGTPLSGPERLFSMYKHHVPKVHDAVFNISNKSPGLLEPVEIARTGIRIAGIQKSKPTFWDPAPLEFHKQLAPGNELRNQLDALIEPAQSRSETTLGRAFATLSRLVRYRDGLPDGQWDFGMPAVLVRDLNPELIRVLIHWAVLSEGKNLEHARGDVIRFALFWHLCVTNDAKAAAQAGQVLRAWTVDGSFPWVELYRRLTGADVSISDEEELGELLDPTDPSALRLVSPRVFCLWGRQDGPTHLLRSWRQRFDKSGSRNTAELFRRWWGRSGMLLWLQRGYLQDILPAHRLETAHDEDRPVDLDHIQPQAAFQEHWSTQEKRLPRSNNVKAAFRAERWTLGNSIGNFRWVPPDINRADGDHSIRDKLRLDQDDWIARSDRRPGARDGAMDPASCDVWQRASAPPDRSWSEDRIAAWQQAVEERAVWLYKRLWQEAEYDLWRSSGSADAIAP